ASAEPLMAIPEMTAAPVRVTAPRRRARAGTRTERCLDMCLRSPPAELAVGFGRSVPGRTQRLHPRRGRRQIWVPRPRPRLCGGETQPDGVGRSGAVPG